VRVGALFGSALGLALATTGCGSESLSRPEYTREVNRICTPAIAQSNELIHSAFSELYGNDLPTDPSPGDLVALYRGILPAARESRDVIEQMLDDLRALPAPAELAGAANDLWEAMEGRLGTSIERIENATHDPRAAVELDVDDTFPFDPENARAAELGFTACTLT
jgi:hypothetical protein